MEIIEVLQFVSRKLFRDAFNQCDAAKRNTTSTANIDRNGKNDENIDQEQHLEAGGDYHLPAVPRQDRGGGGHSAEASK